MHAVGFYGGRADTLLLKDDDGISESEKQIGTTRTSPCSLNRTGPEEFSSLVTIEYGSKAWFTPNYSCTATQDPNVQTNVISELVDRKNVLSLRLSNGK